MSGLEPDLAGFADAQHRLTTILGRDVRFYAPAEMLYDPGISPFAFDAEGFPLDPLAGASAVASADVAIADLSLSGSAHCSVVFRPLQTSIMRRDETTETPLAIRSGLNRDLILNVEDIPQTTDATHFMVGTFARGPDGEILRDLDGSEQEWTPDDGELWKVVNAKTDGLGGFQRYIVYGQGTQ